MQYKEYYSKYIRPDQSCLISLMNLDRDFISGKRNWIYDSKENKYLDLTGSYGANTLGHGNIVRDLAANFLKKSSLSFLQGNRGATAAKLAATFNRFLSEETNQKEWNIQFSNSGAEAVEIALKISHFSFYKKLERRKVKLQEAYNKARKELEKNKDQKLIDILGHIKEHNNAIFELPLKMIALEGAFHGKTVETLKLTYNQKLKNNITHDSSVIRIKREDEVKLVRQIEESKMSIQVPVFEDGRLKVSEESYYPISAIIAEPILGEGGVIELSSKFLHALREQATRIDAMFILDEIQTGCFRTGKLCYSHYHGITADIYTFSKGLSAGFSKCGITAIQMKKFPKGFDLIQSSTFAEDDLSSYVANKTLKLAKSHFENNIENISYLNSELIKLQQIYPSYIKEVRGKGLMLAIDFAKELGIRNYEFKYFFDADMFGYLLSSALLNNENIRIAPTLSNQNSLRVQPSINIQKDEVDYLIKGITNLLNAIKSNDSSYFFSHMFEEKIGPFNNLTEEVKEAITKDMTQTTFFLNHPIETTDVKKIVTAFKYISDEKLEALMHATFHLQKFTPYYATDIIGDNGNKTRIVMLSIPVTSKILYEKFRSKELSTVVNKVQNAIGFAKEHDGSTVGLGQFTSIITKNGMFLNNMGLNLTTGNSYTAKLAYDAGEIPNYLRINNSKPTIGFVGFGGNIITTMVSLAIKDAKKIILFHRGKENLNNKVLACLHELLHYIDGMNCENSRNLREALKLPYETIEILLYNIKDYLVISNSLELLRECDVIYTGTNSTSGLFAIDNLKNGARIVDLAVPGDFFGPTEKDGKIVRVTKGGIASFPKSYNKDVRINIPSFPLQTNQSFACMAETFSMGLSKIKDNVHIGPISINDIEKINIMANSAGFKISGDKNINSM